MNKFSDFFFNIPKTNVVHKWIHYFDIYHKHFSKFQNKSPIILEIGVYKGGSLDMWNYYFDNKCTIYGVDINPECKQYEKDNKFIFIGDQESEEFWKWAENIEFDIIIDDGGHFMNQQIKSFEILYNKVKDNGVYLCEDTHTSYWSEFNGGLLKDGTFIEYTKKFVDYINSYHIQKEIPEYSLEFRKKTHCISFYDSIVVLDKKIDLEQPITIMKS